MDFTSQMSYNPKEEYSRIRGHSSGSTELEAETAAYTPQTLKPVKQKTKRGLMGLYLIMRGKFGTCYKNGGTEDISGT